MKHTLSLLAAGALAALAASAPAQAATGAWADTYTRAIAPEATGAVRKDAMKAGETLHVALALEIHDKAGLDARVAALAAGTGQIMTPDEFLAKHAPTAAEANAVADYLRKAGFTNVSIAKNRMLVTARGTAGIAAAAFNTEFAHFDVQGRAAFANTKPAQVPASLAGTVHAVLGLQTVAIGHTMNRQAHLSHAAAATDGKNASGVAFVHEATDFPALYDAAGLPPATNTTIAIFTLGDLTQTIADLNSFTAAKGFPTVDVQVIPTVDNPVGETTGVIEWNIDTQSSLASAGGQVKQMLLYQAADFSDASVAANLNAFVADDKAQVMNNSWGFCEGTVEATAIMSAEDVVFETAIAQGQVFSFATGDSGSYQCGGKYSGSSWPAVSPWVMAIGGTTLYNKDGKSTVYSHETTWSCSNATDCFDGGGTGGGVSLFESRPSWQLAVVKLPKRASGRALPDLAFDADPNSGIDLMLGGSFDPYSPWGGTSLASPIFSGLWARLQSAHNNTLTSPIFSLYGMYPSGVENSMLHDVTQGENGGFKAAAGWDPVTGFGSFDTAKFNDLINANPGAF